MSENTRTELRDQQKDHFNTIAEEYYSQRQNPNHLLLKDLIWEYFFKGKEYLKDVRSVLEPMCGYSEGYYLLKKFLEIDFSYQGFDYSDRMVEIARRMHPELEVLQGDVTRFEVEEPYDLVIIIGGLHHVHNYLPQTMSAIQKAVKSGGFFINFEPSNNTFLLRKIRELIYKRNHLFDAETERDFRLSEYNHLMQKYDFTILDQIYPGLLSYILYYNPDAFPWLNRGNPSLVKFLFGLDRIFFRNYLGKKFSFSTLSIFRKI